MPTFYYAPTVRQLDRAAFRLADRIARYDARRLSGVLYQTPNARSPLLHSTRRDAGYVALAADQWRSLRLVVQHVLFTPETCRAWAHVNVRHGRRDIAHSWLHVEALDLPSDLNPGAMPLFRQE